MHSTSSKHLIVVVGPTAVGKTSLCIKLAQHLGTEIISADARQCYKQMYIGTAKPTVSEQVAVVHHLIDFLSLEQSYSAVAFEQDVFRILENLWLRFSKVVLTGGSGLYIKAVCEGLASVPSISASMYTQLNQMYIDKGLAPLCKELALLDPKYYQEVDKCNPHRVIRALAVCRTTGKTYTYFRTKNSLERPFKITKIGLKIPREVLYKRINDRVDQMVAQGLFEEAKKLYSYRDYQALQTVGYKEVFSFLAGDYDKAHAIALLKRNTRRYAKRQMTWFNKDPQIRWFHPSKWEAIKDYIDGH